MVIRVIDTAFAHRPLEVHRRLPRFQVSSGRHPQRPCSGVVQESPGIAARGRRPRDSGHPFPQRNGGVVPDIDECRAEGLRLAVELHAAQDDRRDPFACDALPERVIRTPGSSPPGCSPAPHRSTSGDHRHSQSRPTRARLSPQPDRSRRHGRNHHRHPDATYPAPRPRTARASRCPTPHRVRGRRRCGRGAVTPNADGSVCVFTAVAPGTANGHRDRRHHLARGHHQRRPPVTPRPWSLTAGTSPTRPRPPDTPLFWRRGRTVLRPRRAQQYRPLLIGAAFLMPGWSGHRT